MGVIPAPNRAAKAEQNKPGPTISAKAENVHNKGEESSRFSYEYYYKMGVIPAPNRAAKAEQSKPGPTISAKAETV